MFYTQNKLYQWLSTSQKVTSVLLLSIILKGQKSSSPVGVRKYSLPKHRIRRGFSSLSIFSHMKDFWSKKSTLLLTRKDQKGSLFLSFNHQTDTVSSVNILPPFELDTLEVSIMQVGGLHDHSSCICLFFYKIKSSWNQRRHNLSHIGRKSPVALQQFSVKYLKIFTLAAATDPHWEHRVNKILPPHGDINKVLEATHHAIHLLPASLTSPSSEIECCFTGTSESAEVTNKTVTIPL